jgi:hypothetical protein
MEQESTQVPTQTPPLQQAPEQPQVSASVYYDKHRKHSFFLSRVTVLSSMVVLVLAIFLLFTLKTIARRSLVRQRHKIRKNYCHPFPQDVSIIK